MTATRRTDAAAPTVVDVTDAAVAVRRDRMLRRLDPWATGATYWVLVLVSAPPVSTFFPEAPSALQTVAVMLGGAGGAVGMHLAIRSRATSRIASARVPLFSDPRVRGAGVFAVIVVRLVFWGNAILWFVVVLVAGLILAPALNAPDVVVNAAVPLLAVGWFMVVAGVTGWTVTWVRRLLQRPAAEAARRDGRPPIVYLRPFDATGLRLRSARTWVGIRRSVSFESLLVDRLWRRGPVLVAAEPLSLRGQGEVATTQRGNVVYTNARGWQVERPDVGSFGGPVLRIRSEQWRADVDAWLRQAQIIVAVVGSTAGLLWELDRIRELELMNRLVLVIPPGAERETAAGDSRWGLVRAHVEEERVSVPASIHTESRVALAGVLSSPMLIDCATDDADAYVVALERALAVLDAERGPR